MNPTLQKTLLYTRVIPDTVNRTGRHRLDASGKGVNVSRVLSQLGKDPVHLTQLGGALRPLFLELCREDGLRIEWVESGSPIRFCYTLLNEEDRTVTELVEESGPVEEGTGERLEEAYLRLLPACHTVIISGTKAPGFSGDLVPRMVRAAREAGRRIILDVRGPDLVKSLPFRPDLVKPNLFEFAQTFAPELIHRNGIAGEEGAVRERVREIAGELGAAYGSAVVLTRGAGPVWILEGKDFAEVPFEAVPALNATGSGDAFTAGLAAALEEGASLREAVREGTRCGRLNAELLRPGVILPEEGPGPATP
jgi:1-phosphofructokinase/tagatose 6-phosphate kinase